MEEVSILIEAQARDMDAAIEIDIPADAPVIQSDPYQLRQVLLNLVSNAIQAGEKGQTVSISAAVTENNIIIEVADRGAGIPPENLQKVFEPFFTTKAPDKGTGLGLFVSRNIVETLGGEIEVQSRVGEGSNFKVILPRRSKESQVLA